MSIGLISCHKDEVVDPDDATLEIFSPTQNQAVNSNETVTVTAKATSPTTLHGYKIEVNNESTGVEIFKNEVHTHGNDIDIEETFVNSAKSGESVKITITVALDHDQNTIDDSVIIITQ